MAEAYSVAVLQDKRVYSLGTKSSVKAVLLLLLEKEVKDKTFVFYYDGGFNEDKFEDELAFDIVDYDFIKKEDIPFSEAHTLSSEEFTAFYKRFMGKETNREEVIQHLKTLGKVDE